MENIRINFVDSKTETEKTVEVTGEYVFTHIFARLLPSDDYPVTALAGGGLYFVYFLDLRDCGYNGDIPLPGHVVYDAFEEEDKSIISTFLHMSALNYMRTKKTVLLPLNDIANACGDMTKFADDEWRVLNTPSEFGMDLYLFASNDIDTPALLLDPMTDKKIRALEPFKNGYYIVPSSIHEVLLVPITPAANPEALRSCTKTVNSAVVAPNEILGDHIYKLGEHGYEIVV